MERIQKAGMKWLAVMVALCMIVSGLSNGKALTVRAEEGDPDSDMTFTYDASNVDGFGHTVYTVEDWVGYSNVVLEDSVVVKISERGNIHINDSITVGSGSAIEGVGDGTRLELSESVVTASGITFYYWDPEYNPGGSGEPGGFRPMEYPDGNCYRFYYGCIGGTEENPEYGWIRYDGLWEGNFEVQYDERRYDNDENPYTPEVRTSDVHVKGYWDYEDPDDQPYLDMSINSYGRSYFNWGSKATLTFTLTPSELDDPATVNPLVIIDYDWDTADKTLTVGSGLTKLSESSYSFTVAPSTEEPFTVRIYWSEEAKAFEEITERLSDTIFMVEYENRGGGTITHEALTEANGYLGEASLGSWTRLLYNSSLNEINFTLTPSADENTRSSSNVFIGERYEENAILVNDETFVGTYTLDLSQGVPAPISFEFCYPPRGVHINLMGENNTPITASVNGTGIDLVPTEDGGNIICYDGMFSPEYSGEYKLEFTSCPENFKGLSYYVFDGWESGKVHNTSETALVLDKSKAYDISLLIRDEAPLYDGQCEVSYNDFDGSVSVKVNGVAVADRARVNYEGNNIKLSYEVAQGGPDITVSGVSLRYEFDPDSEIETVTDPITSESGYITNGCPVFINIEWSEDTSSEDPHGEDPQEENPPVSGDPRVAVKAALENMTFAYYGNNAATIKGYFAKEIWNQLFKPDRPYGNLNIFTDETTLGSMNFLSADTSTVNSEITENGVLLPYYTYTLSLGNTAGFETVTAEGRIYLLQNAMDFGVKFVKGGLATYKIFDATGSNQFNAITAQGAYDMYEDEHHDLVPNVYFFGNGLDSLNYYSNTENRNSWKYAFRTNLTNEHTGVAIAGAAGYVAVNVVNSETKAVRINGNDANGSAAAWSWSSFDIYETNSGTAENPREATVFVGATEIYIDSYNGEGIREITCSLDTAARAVAISTSGTSFVIKPLSNFYDELPLIITCGDGSKAYLNIKRVAMDVRYISVPGDRNNEISIFHNMHMVDQSINGNGALVSSFYYQQDRDPVYNPGASRVKLRVLYTWANGTTTQETVSPINASVQDMRDQAGHVSENGSAGVDDFILWQGDYSNAPIKAEIIAVLPSTDDNFGGALIGAGSGYVWRKE